MTKDQLISALRLREVLHYDPETGVFTWLVDRMCGRYMKQFAARVGDIAGNVGKDKRVQLRVDGHNYRAHRLAWLYVYGTWPSKEIDHRDGDASNNRIANLREVTHKENGENRRRPNRANKIGILGVRRHWKRYAAHISINGKNTYLGLFDTAKEAHDAYISAKREHHAGSTL